MVVSDLNRFWKRLYKKFNEKKWNNDPDFFDFLENELKPEYRRLYGADSEFKYINKNSILIAIVLNRKFALIPPHRFGIDIDESIKF